MTTIIFYNETGKEIGSVSSLYHVKIGDIFHISITERYTIKTLLDPVNAIFTKEQLQEIEIGEANKHRARREAFNQKRIQIKSIARNYEESNGTSSIVIHCYCKILDHEE